MYDDVSACTLISALKDKYGMSSETSVMELHIVSQGVTDLAEKAIHDSREVLTNNMP